MECGGSPPLFAVRARPDVLHPRTIAAILLRGRYREASLCSPAQISSNQD